MVNDCSIVSEGADIQAGFHDTSVLVNVHRPGLIPVLGQLLRDNVCWTATIRTEYEWKQRQLELRGLVEALPAPACTRTSTSR